MSKSNYTTQQLEKITPDVARAYLAVNDNPRDPKKHQVDEFVRIIRAGEFRTLHQGLAFDDHGNLVDGQHRLFAVVEAGIAVHMWVARGLSKLDVQAIDRGMMRNNATVMGVDIRVAPIITQATYVLLSHVRKPLTGELMKVKAVLEDNCNELISACGYAKAKVTTASMRLGAVMNMFNSAGKAYTMVQYPALVRGDFPAMTPMIQAFYRRLVESSRAMSGHMVLANAYRAFNPKNAHLKSVGIRTVEETLADMRKALGNLITL